MSESHFFYPYANTHPIFSICMDVRQARLAERYVAPSSPIRLLLPRERVRGRERGKREEKRVKESEKVIPTVLHVCVCVCVCV